MIVAAKTPRGTAGRVSHDSNPPPWRKPYLASKRFKAGDDGVRITTDGKLYHAGSLHVAVLLESTTSHPCAEHK